MRLQPKIILASMALLLLMAAPGAGVIVISHLDLQGEAVAIVNAGSAPVDMTGWTLTDEEITHTYTFPSFTLASEAGVTVPADPGVNSATHLY